MTEIFFVTGASVSGKTATLKALESEQTPKNAVIYYFDTIGVPPLEELPSGDLKAEVASIAVRRRGPVHRPPRGPIVYFPLLFAINRTSMSAVNHAKALAADAYPHLTKITGVRGGNAIVKGTRIGVHDVIGLLQNGETVETLISRCFPELTRAQVFACLAYYEDHRGEIDLLVARQAPGESP